MASPPQCRTPQIIAPRQVHPRVGEDAGDGTPSNLSGVGPCPRLPPGAVQAGLPSLRSGDPDLLIEVPSRGKETFEYPQAVAVRALQDPGYAATPARRELPVQGIGAGSSRFSPRLLERYPDASPWQGPKG